MKASELRGKSILELNDELHSLCKEQFNLRVQRKMGEAQKLHDFKNVRRNIARIKTILNEKKARG